jgi:hypothetical protein
VRRIREADPFAPPSAPPRAEDPFASAGPDLATLTISLAETSDTLVRPLARRDPDALPEDTSDCVTGAASFDDVLRRARRRGFLAGAAGGVVAGAALAAAVVALVRPATVAVAPVVPALSPRGDGREEGRAADDARDPHAGRGPAAVPDLPAPLRPSRSPRAAGGARGEGARPARAGEEAGEGARAAGPVRDGGEDAQEAAAGAPGIDLRSAAETATPGEPPDAPDDAVVATPAEAPAPPRRLEEAEVAAALASRRDALDACFAAADAGAPPGSVVRLLVRVEPSGRVAGARTDDPLLDESPLGACLGEVARAMSFEPFEGDPVRVELPLRLGGE